MLVYAWGVGNSYWVDWVSSDDSVLEGEKGRGLVLLSPLNEFPIQKDKLLSASILCPPVPIEYNATDTDPN